MGCIFCKIISGQIPCFRVFEDEKVLCFMDVNPLSDGHALVIPKTHAATIHEISEADFSAVMAAVHRVAGALKKALNPDGINLMQLNGKAANQVVPHLHVHIVPRWTGDNLSISRWEPAPGDMAQIKAVSDKVRKALS